MSEQRICFDCGAPITLENKAKNASRYIVVHAGSSASGVGNACKHGSATQRARNSAVNTIWRLIERIGLSPGAKWAEMDATLHHDLRTILERTAGGNGKARTDIPMPEMPVSVVAEAGSGSACSG